MTDWLTMRAVQLMNRFQDSKSIGLRRHDEGGFTTAELMGNAALGIAALAAIYIVLREFASDFLINFIKGKINAS